MQTNADWNAIERDLRDKAHRTIVDDLKNQVASRQIKIEELSKQLDVALAIDRKVKPVRITATEGKASESVAFAIASDWHVEETVTPASVSGLNEYDLSIADARIKKFAASTVKLTEIQRAGTDIKTLVLFLGGDFMTGHIHEEFVESNGLSPVQTIDWLIDRIAGVVRHLRKHFDRLIVVCSYGNHGRTTKKPRHSTGAANSFEWLMYRVLSRQLTDGIEWHIAEGYHQYLDIFNHTIRFHHGDAIRYEGGIGGITIPIEKAIASWNKGRKADIDIFGHWHQYIAGRHFVCNSSLIGYNAFAVAIKAPFEPPQQTFFLLDAKRGRTITAPIFVT